MKRPIRTAVIGVGYLGKFHAQKYAALASSELIAVVDHNLSLAQEIAAPLKTRAVQDYRDILEQIDAVSIAVPTRLHYQIAADLLRAGKHVLLEKPMTVTVAEADELIALAQQHHCVLQIGHLERFNPAIVGLDKLLTNPLFIESHRLAPFKLRATDVNVILDLMIHDIDIILDLVRSDVIEIAASGAKVLSNSVDIANARLTFANGCVANVTASRVSLKTERKMRIFQDNTYISVDFQNRVLSHHYRGTEETSEGVPKIESAETVHESGDALLAEIESFLHCIQHQQAPLVSGSDGRRALATAIRITELMKANLQL
ncbi:MAG: Gfo/Idh/MocA family oxidoreductase [Gammaproteobacteria bacterium]|nr:Gfo/Idh/MocA family oxidoreductase [Gammaproteobacteria bacterium]